ncbi:hypothetical protein [Tropicimonas sp. S265A]|uniref:hypothetical protein n=1 Tax=Tropicimonas sp. S265A TaxID=3415134 RepID=UPI003C7A7BD5
MTPTLAASGKAAAKSETAPAPKPPLRGPVLMADILTAPGGQPSLLRLWDAWDMRKGTGSSPSRVPGYFRT